MKGTNLFLGFLLSIFYASAQESALFEANIDLNGDGKPESVKLIEDQNYQYSLYINQLEKKVQFGQEGFLIFDIDTTDAYKEIAVFTPGPSDDYEYEIFRYQNNRLHRLGHLEGWITVNGDGTLYTDNGEGFWFKREVYFLNNQTLSLGKFPLKNEFYVGAQATVTKKFQIYNDLNNLEPFLKVKPQTVLKILTAILFEDDNGDFNYVYQVVTQDGLVGYIQQEPLLQNTEGLIMAD